MKVMAVIFIGVAAAMFVLMYMFSVQAIGATDMNVNLSGTAYQNAYNGSVNMSKIGISSIGFVPTFLGISALIGALFMMFAAIKMKG